MKSGGTAESVDVKMAQSVGSAPTELGTEKISTLLKMYAIPGIIAQTAASLYNMVDSIYIGHIPGVGSDAISGLAVTFPLMNLSAAMGTLVGVGGMTLISVLLGQKNYDSAKKVLSNVFALNLIIGLVFSVVTLSFLDPILYFFGASERTIFYAREYMKIILIGNVVTHLYFGFNGLIRSSGHPKTAMGLTLFTVISNAILDPILIFGFELGIRGAAIATVVCQVAALAYTLVFFANKSRLLHFTKPLLQIDSRIAGQCFAIGVGPFLMNAASSLVAMMVNKQLAEYGSDMAIGAYGIVNRATTFFVMICFGFNQGLQPIAGYNYGARLYHRVKEVFIMTAKWEVLVTTVCFLVSMLIPRVVVGLFSNDPEMIDLASRGLRIMNLCVAFVGFNFVAGNLFQCLGMVKTAIVLALSRQLICLLPFIYLLPLWFDVEGVWISFPIADLISTILAAIFIIRLMRKFDRLKDGEDSSILGSAIK